MNYGTQTGKVAIAPQVWESLNVILLPFAVIARSLGFNESSTPSVGQLPKRSWSFLVPLNHWSRMPCRSSYVQKTLYKGLKLGKARKSTIRRNGLGLVEGATKLMQRSSKVV